MKKTDVAIVGGSAAGLTAAITARRHYPDKKITLIRKEKLVPIPCGIPYIFGTVGSTQKNLIPDTPLEKHNVDFIIDEVAEIDREKRSLKTAGGEEIGYDKLVIATGSVPMMPPIPGFEKENVYPVFKDVERLNKMQDKMKASKKVVVIGGGFIGVEMSDEMNKMGNLDVTICELLPHCLQLAFDSEFCDEAEKLITDAEKLQKIGCFAIVLEKIPASLGKKVAEELKIPVIGIGAGSGVDGQVLVIHDMLGITQQFSPRFLRRYHNLAAEIKGAVSTYIHDVKSLDFPNEKEQY